MTAYGDDLAETRERARHAAAWFRGDAGDQHEDQHEDQHGDQRENPLVDQEDDR